MFTNAPWPYYNRSNKYVIPLNVEDIDLKCAALAEYTPCGGGKTLLAVLLTAFDLGSALSLERDPLEHMTTCQIKAFSAGSKSLSM